MMFDPTITLGNVFTIIAITGGGLAAWFKLSSKVENISLSLADIKQWQTRVEERMVTAETIGRIDAKIADLRKEVDDYHRRLGSAEMTIVQLRTTLRLQTE